MIDKNLISSTNADQAWMQCALELAARAEVEGEVPVGALVIMNGEIIGQGWNQPIRSHDPSAHAEIVALRAAAARLENYRVTGATLYVTLEPCPMCAGSIVLARIQRVVFGATDPLAGAAGSVFNILESAALNHRVQLERGVLAEECGARLKAFFQARRARGVGS